MRSPSDHVKRSPLVRVSSSHVESGVIFDVCNGSHSRISHVDSVIFDMCNGRQSRISQVESGVTFDICNCGLSRILQTSCE